MDFITFCEKINLQSSVIEDVSKVIELNQVKYQKYVDDLTNPIIAEDTYRKIEYLFKDDVFNVNVLSIYLLAAMQTYNKYLQIGIAENIFIDTMKCFTRFISEAKIKTGTYYFDRGFWTHKQTSMLLFRIGELEYELIKEPENIINIHIPSDAKLSKLSIEYSLYCCREFLKVYYPNFDNSRFECESWLLSLELKKYLPQNSNILLFQEYFDIKHVVLDSNEFIEWLFKTNDNNIEKFKEETSLQRKVKKALLNGEKIGHAFGVLKKNVFKHILFPQGRNLKVLQLADLHFGIEGKDWHNDKVSRTIEFMNDMINTISPDVIVCSGDNVLSTGVLELKKFIELIDQYKIPWLFVYGNHEAEYNMTGFSKKELAEILRNSSSKYLIYADEYVESGYENRYGNYCVPVLDEETKKVIGSFIVLDSGQYDYELKAYQTITSGQILWHSKLLNNLEDVNENMSTVIFSHMQLPEFQELYLKALDDETKFVIKQDLTEEEIKSMKYDGPLNSNGFFEQIRDSRMVKAYLVGHAHTLKFQIKEKNTIFGFAPQTGFSKLFKNNDLKRKSYYYELTKNFDIKTYEYQEKE